MVKIDALRTTKEVLGFTNGYITIFKNITPETEIFFQESPICRFNTLWGWFIPSEFELPTLPIEVTPLQLTWEAVSKPDGSLKPETAIQQAVDDLIYEPSPSKHFGSIGQRLDLTLTVLKTIPITDKFTTKTMHIFSTPEGNIATWTTTTKTLEEGMTFAARGTVTAHEIYKREPQTRLSRVTVK